MDHNDDVSATKESKPGATKQPVMLDSRHARSTQHTAASWELQIPWIALQRVFSAFISPIKNISKDYPMLLSSHENIFVFFEMIFNTFFSQNIQSQLKELGLAQEKCFGMFQTIIIWFVLHSTSNSCQQHICIGISHCHSEASLSVFT